MAFQAKTNTMSEALSGLLGQVAQMATLPDADMAFVTQLQQMIVQKLRSGMPNPHAGGMPGRPGAAGPPPGLGGGPGAGMPPGLAPQGPPPGMNTGGARMGVNPGQPGVDDLMRMLAGNAA